MAERQYSLAVLRFPGNNSEHPASSGWVISHVEKWITDKRISKWMPFRASDTPITMVRNVLVRSAQAAKADYILMIDSDMIPDFEPDGLKFWDVAWEFMMERRAREETYRRCMSEPMTYTKEAVDIAVMKSFPPATIAAPYCGPPPSEAVYVMRWLSNGGNDPRAPRPYTLEMFDRDHAAAFTGIFEVAALPTGLILYDARVFDILPPPWFEYEWTDEYHSQKSSTEDIFQTRNASLIGLPQFCAWDCWAGHVKTKTVRKPRVLGVEDVPNAMADAVRKGTRGDYKVQVIRSPEDQPSRPTEVPTDSQKDPVLLATKEDWRLTEQSMCKTTGSRSYRGIIGPD